MKSPHEILGWLDRILPSIQKPGRYYGGELNQVLKDWGETDLHIALAFPDIYDLGMPNLGLAILYDIINKRRDLFAERVYLPWLDMEAAMRKDQVPLYSLESKHPLIEFDILGITLPYESLYTNVLNLLDLAQIPLQSKDRGEGYPLIIAGGHAATNPEPMAPFIDAFVVGEGEEAIIEIIDAVKKAKKQKFTRIEILESLSHLDGIYVPAFYKPEYLEDGTLATIRPLKIELPNRIIKRVVAKLPAPITDFIVPSIDVVHNRIAMEIMRGCTRGCRFCQAGMITRPVRERAIPEILASLEAALKKTGYEEIALLSLSSSDYTHIRELVSEITRKFQNKHLTISLPSLRIESLSIDLLQQLTGSRQSSFTLAPEAGSDRLRKTINKFIPGETLIELAREIYGRGWLTIKLYFMIGLPGETEEDIFELIHLCRDVISEGKRIHGRKASLHINIGTFIPKPHTPFQWQSLEKSETIELKQRMLRDHLRQPGIKVNWPDHKNTMLEGWLSRGDRRIAEVILRAWEKGAKFDAWQDQFKFEVWESSFSECGLDPDFYVHRKRSLDEVFPWDIINIGVKKEFLVREYKWSQEGRLRPDCRDQCSACGILTTYASFRSMVGESNWKCPESEPSTIDGIG